MYRKQGPGPEARAGSAQRRGEFAEAAALYSIRTVAHLTGVNPITLRAWEARYGFLKPIRKQSGHRLYTQEHIDLINRAVGLLERGMRIGDVGAALALDGSNEDGKAQHEAEPWRRYREGMLAAVIRFDEDALEAVYSDALSLHSIGVVTDRLLSPLLRDLGQRWAAGQGSVAEEHFFGFYLRNKLGARFHHRVRRGRGARLLMACMPGERHEIGLLLFALAASESGYEPIVLGADMPVEELAAAADKTACAAIVLAASIRPAAGVLQRDLPELVRSASVPVLMGGRASGSAFDELKRAGVESLGADIEAGLRHLQTLVPPAAVATDSSQEPYS